MGLLKGFGLNDQERSKYHDAKTCLWVRKKSLKGQIKFLRDRFSARVWGLKYCACAIMALL